MTHEESALLLPDLDKGRLAPEEEAAVRAHMADCTECRGLNRAYQIVSAALHVKTEHPDSADLVVHAMGTVVRPELEAHLTSCPSCSQQAAAIRAAESELRTRRIPVRAWSAWAAAAAACVLLGYVGWVHFSVLPRMRAAIARAEDGAAADAETMALPLLTSATRGAEEPVAVPVRAGQRAITVAVAPALPRDLADSEVLRIEVRERGGGVVFSREITAGEIRRLSGKSGAFALVLPASVLPTGDASLYIHATAQGELLAAPFRVRRD